MVDLEKRKGKWVIKIAKDEPYSLKTHVLPKWLGDEIDDLLDDKHYNAIAEYRRKIKELLNV